MLCPVAYMTASVARNATGIPAAVQNAIEHYRIDDILISTFAGQSSAWLDDGLIDRVKGITDKPVEHLESQPDGDSAPAPAEAETAVAGGVEG